MRSVFILILTWGALGILGLPQPGVAQDVEMLGEHHGTRPPDAYFQERDRDPTAFQFEREGRDRLLHIQEHRSDRGIPFHEMILRQGEPARSLGPRDEPVVGTFRVPLILGLFSDSPTTPPYTRDRVQEEFFDGPNSYYQTLSELYDEMSRGQAQIEGATFPWHQVGLRRSQVTLGSGGLISSRDEGVGAFIESILTELDAQGVDWSRYDNTGDGFVDVLSVMHPNAGAECTGGGDQVWSHRWSLRSATQGRLNPGFQTSTPRSDGDGYIYINDYIIQPVKACGGEEINQIGVFAHELGHAFGLPDLYGTRGAAVRGAGRWDLMGTGTWGCQGEDPARPCHMSAWTKSMLGWVDVVEVQGDAELESTILPPVLSSGQVLRVPAAGSSSEYLLLENRQRMGSESNLWEPGLLIWHVDDAVVNARWAGNTVNNDPDRLGVWLRQADGTNALAEAGATHGDPGDPYPGCIKDDYWDYFRPSVPCVRTNTEFHFGSAPAARTHDGQPFGATLTGIELVGAEPYDIRFDLVTRFSRVTLASQGDEHPGGISSFIVDGEARDGDPLVIEAVPFQRLVLEAPPGEEFEEGVRVGFQGWSDGEERIRELVVPLTDTTLLASYGGTEVKVSWTAQAENEVDGSNQDVAPGQLSTDPSSPDLWFPLGSVVEVEARATPGFTFSQWTGVLAGRENPVTLTLDEPVALEGAFRFIYAVEEPEGPFTLPAAEPGEIRLQVTDGSAPVQWSVVEGELPAGLVLRQEPQAGIQGVPMEMGATTLTIQARDAQGLEARAQVVLEVGIPRIGVGDVMAPFLGGGGELSSAQKEFLDQEGNADGAYDVGDARRFLREHPELPETRPGPVAERGAARSNPWLAGGGPTPPTLWLSFSAAEERAGSRNSGDGTSNPEDGARNPEDGIRNPEDET